MLNKILILDDSEALLQNYRVMFKRYNCLTITALRREEGFTKLTENPDVSLILVDMNMLRSHMSALEFIQKVKEHEAFMNIPIIAVNTRGKEDNLQEALELTQGILTKPFTSNEVHAVMGRFLSISEPEPVTL